MFSPQELYGLPRVQTNEYGDLGWRKGVDKKDDGPDGRPNLGIHLGATLVERRLEG